MRKMKWMVAFLLLCVLTGCAGKTLPEGMTEEKLLAAGREVLLLAVEGEYESVHALLREDVREGVTADQIRELLLSQTEDAGDYKQIEDSMTTAQTAQGETFGVAVLYCEYSEDDVLFRISFDREMQFIGLAVQKQ